MAVLLTGPAAAKAGPGMPHNTWTRDEVKVQSTGLFDGSKHRRHIFCLWNVVQALEALFGKGFVQREAPLATAPPDRRTFEPEPDACVLRGRIESYPDSPKPDDVLLVDSTLNQDLTVKAEIQARAGFTGYWVADVNGRKLHVLRDPADGEYRTLGELGEAEGVERLAAPGRSIRIADLLP